MTISRFTIQENDRIFNELFGHQDIKGITPKGMVRMTNAMALKCDGNRCKGRKFTINGIEFKPTVNCFGMYDGYDITNGDKTYKNVSWHFWSWLNGIFVDPTTSNI